MAGQLTWYDIFDIAAGSSADEVRRAFDEKTGVLRPELMSGSSSKVVAAAERARAALEAGRHILTDPASRRRYDEEIGIRAAGGGLSAPEPSPRSAWAWSGRGGMDGEFVLDTIADAVGDWLAPHPVPARHIPVPDVRGLFVGPCRRLLGDRGLHVEVVLLVQDPMPVEGLVVDQSPPPVRSVRRDATVTVQVWHPRRQAS